MTRFLTAFFLLASGGDALAQTPEDAPAPEDPSTPEATVHDVVEEAPQIIGGLAALTARVVYPDSALAAGVGGVVYVSAVVDTSGIAHDPVVRRTPDASLGAAAAAALDGLAFTPGRNGGVPVLTRVTLPVRFEPPPMPTEIEADFGSLARPIGGWDRVQGSVVWPPEALAAGVEGVIRVAIAVAADGSVTDVTVIESDVRQDEGRMDMRRSSANTLNIGSRDSRAHVRPSLSRARAALEKALIEAVYATRFIPAVNNGATVSSTVTYGLEFVLYN